METGRRDLQALPTDYWLRSFCQLRVPTLIIQFSRRQIGEPTFGADFTRYPEKSANETLYPRNPSSGTIRIVQ